MLTKLLRLESARLIRGNVRKPPEKAAAGRVGCLTTVG
jgi:hypothetical protein